MTAAVDELLPRQRSALKPMPSRLRATQLRLPRLPRLEGLSLPNFLERRTKAGPIVFLCAALAVSFTGIVAHLYTPCTQVTVNGVSFGLVESQASVEAAIDRVEDRASHILGYDYTLDQNVEYSFQVALKEDIGSVSPIETYLFDQIGELMKTSVLSVDGRVLGATDDGSGLTALLNSIKARYITPDTVSVQFTEDVTVTKDYTSTAAIKQVSDLGSILTSNTMEEVDYAVQAGDTFSGIANSMDMSVKQLQALNPQVEDIAKIQIGDQLVVSQAVPYLSVKTVDNVTYDGPVAYETQEVPDDTIYQGYTKVLTPGVEGWATYNADVSYLNGVEQERTINSTDVHSEPVTEVVAVGTKPRPKTMATGKFIWPIYGKITSGYGNRYIFGSYSNHSGIDIAGSYGAPIKAADGGRVTWAGTGTGSYWSYGKYVVIDHENGLQSIYGHCSSLCVKAGERVYQGQVIAKVGSTGRSTGNHCHFQIKEGGVTVNPYNYLP